MEGRANISVLGSTGSVGEQTLEVCRRLGIKPAAITGNRNVRKLEAQAREFNPDFVGVYDKESASQLRTALSDTDIDVIAGMDGLIAAAAYEKSATVVTAVSGAVGLLPTMAAIDEGKRIALANKETLVCAGDIVMERAALKNAKILPVDSEHSAIFQCLEAGRRSELERILLTASGGPFRGRKLEDIYNATSETALKHPNWSMGAKISIDSATMMNKGLEFIEAMHLFAAAYEDIEILLHPESIIHSMVEFVDGSVIAQLAQADMSLPIQYALTYPERISFHGKRLDLFTNSMLTFEKPDMTQLPCLRLALECARQGGTAPAVMSAANEAAVDMFLKGLIPFGAISECIAGTLDSIILSKAADLETVLEADRMARQKAYSFKIS